MSATTAEPPPEIYPETVDGACLLDELTHELKRFVILPKNAEFALALWILHTYCFEKFDYSPIILITSPERECGKSRVIDMLVSLTSNPDRTDNSSAAVLYNTISDTSPTLLVDEFDGLPKEQKIAISNVLKSGFHRTGSTKRMVGSNYENVRTFKTYCPKALGAIKVTVFDKAVQSRSINIPMQRKKRNETTERFRKYDGAVLRSKCRRWVRDNSNSIGDELCELPEELSDRQQDIWEPLICLASLAGKTWEEKALNISVQYGAETANSAASSGTFLLIWIKKYFDQFCKDRVGSNSLCDWLNENDERGFKPYRDGLGINPSIIGSMLKHYGIAPRTVRDGSETFKGYCRDNFEDAFEAYIPTPPPDDGGICRHTVTPLDSIGQSGVNGDDTQLTCDGAETVDMTNDSSACDGVTGINRVPGGKLDLPQEFYETFPA